MKLLAIAVAAFLANAVPLALDATAAEPAPKTVAALYQEKAALAGKIIKTQGNVVKVNNGIMGRNFVHVQDGSGDAKAGTNDLIVTSKQTVKIGDSVSISGLVVLNRDFGSGYAYPLLIEDATITAKK